jgi:prevent-host-death family protein
VRSITATEFRARCLALFDEVAETREPLVVTKRGKPVARVIPAEGQRSLIGTVTYHISDDELVHGGLDWSGFGDDE